LLAVPFNERSTNAEWIDAKKRVTASLRTWWKRHFRIPASDERFQRLTWQELYEDYIEHLILDDVVTVSTDSDYANWQNTVMDDPDAFERWAMETKTMIDTAN